MMTDEPPVPWLAGTTRTDWLYNGHKPPSEEVWAQLEWDKAWVDLGPSPMGNPGPYWHVPLNDGEETVQRLYPKILLSKWLLIIRQACLELAAKEHGAAEAGERRGDD